MLSQHIGFFAEHTYIFISLVSYKKFFMVRITRNMPLILIVGMIPVTFTCTLKYKQLGTNWL